MQASKVPFPNSNLNGLFTSGHCHPFFSTLISQDKAFEFSDLFLEQGYLIFFLQEILLPVLQKAAMFICSWQIHLHLADLTAGFWTRVQHKIKQWGADPKASLRRLVMVPEMGFSKGCISWEGHLTAVMEEVMHAVIHQISSSNACKQRSRSLLQDKMLAFTTAHHTSSERSQFGAHRGLLKVCIFSASPNPSADSRSFIWKHRSQLSAIRGRGSCDTHTGVMTFAKSLGVPWPSKVIVPEQEISSGYTKGQFKFD